MEETRALSRNIKAIRKQRKLSLVHFAEELGIAKSTLEQIEQGGSPNLSTVEQIASQLKLPVQALLSPAYTEHVDLLFGLLRAYDWFFRLPPEQQPAFSAWVKEQIDALIRFSQSMER